MSVATAGHPRKVETLSPEARRQFCTAMLPRVSRTFALSIRFLPKRLRYTVSVSYLLCRIADTIEDASSEVIESDRKVRFLELFSDNLGRMDVGTLAEVQGAFGNADVHEPELVRRSDVVLHEFFALSEAERNCIRPWVQRMCEGMDEYLRGGMGQDTDDGPVKTIDDLERYCYFVAGTVGNLLTELFYLGRGEEASESNRLAYRFGLGLQLTNVIKDLYLDAERGRYFVPVEACATHGITQREMLRAEHADTSLAIMRDLIARAKEHLSSALEYACLIPRSEYGIRMFCLVSLFLALKTLGYVASHEQPVGRARTLKIGRSDVYRTVIASLLVARSNALCRGYYRLLARAVPG